MWAVFCLPARDAEGPGASAVAGADDGEASLPVTRRDAEPKDRHGDKGEAGGEGPSRDWASVGEASPETTILGYDLKDQKM